MHIPDVLAVELNADIQTAFGGNCVFASSSCSALGRSQHGVHESLKGLIHLVVLCFLIAGLDVIDNVVVQDVAEDLVSAAEQSKEEGQQTGGRDHLPVTQKNQRLDHCATELSIEDLVVL